MTPNTLQENPSHNSSRLRGVLLALLVGLCVSGIILGALIWRNHKDTGEWSLPTADTMVRIAGGSPTSGKPSRTIYLHRGAIELKAGTDNAPANISSVVKSGTKSRVTLPGFLGSNSQWRAIMKCTKQMFRPFDVVVTDALPINDDYILVAVGGKVSALGLTKHAHASGLAPFSSQVIPKAVVFAFSATLRNKPKSICDVIAMEVGHAYGLDHSHNCKDVMTYLKRCGNRSFVDTVARCGEAEPRDCANGDKTQNTLQHMLGVLGPAVE